MQLEMKTREEADRHLHQLINWPHSLVPVRDCNDILRRSGAGKEMRERRGGEREAHGETAARYSETYSHEFFLIHMLWSIHYTRHCWVGWLIQQSTVVHMRHFPKFVLLKVLAINLSIAWYLFQIISLNNRQNNNKMCILFSHVFFSQQARVTTLVSQSFNNLELRSHSIIITGIVCTTARSRLRQHVWCCRYKDFMKDCPDGFLKKEVHYINLFIHLSDNNRLLLIHISNRITSHYNNVM